VHRDEVRLFCVGVCMFYVGESTSRGMGREVKRGTETGMKGRAKSFNSWILDALTALNKVERIFLRRILAYESV